MLRSKGAATTIRRFVALRSHGARLGAITRRLGVAVRRSKAATRRAGAATMGLHGSRNIIKYSDKSLDNFFGFGGEGGGG